MPKSSAARGAKKRVKVKDLAAPEKKMSAREMKKVKGGLPAVQRTGDGSVRTGKGQVDNKLVGPDILDRDG